jgi:hypothetical protein
LLRAGADPALVNEDYCLLVVQYQRLGFRLRRPPRLKRHADEPNVRSLVATMVAGLEAF